MKKKLGWWVSYDKDIRHWVTTKKLGEVKVGQITTALYKNRPPRCCTKTAVHACECLYKTHLWQRWLGRPRPDPQKRLCRVEMRVPNNMAFDISYLKFGAKSRKILWWITMADFHREWKLSAKKKKWHKGTRKHVEACAYAAARKKYPKKELL
jgi:hypothetical protein